MTDTTPPTLATRVTAITAALSAALVLAACSPGGQADGQSDAACAAMQNWSVPSGAQSVAVVLDNSKSMRDSSWLDTALAPFITRAAGVYSSLSVLLADGQGAIPRWLVDDLPLNNKKFEFGTLHYNQAVERAAGCVAQMIGDPVPSMPGTDLGASIQVAGDRLVTASGPRTLIVVSDGLSNAGPIDLTGAIGQTAIERAVSKLDSAGYRPDLSGVDVTFAGLGVTAGGITAGPAVTWLRNYYTAICERAGAAQCEAPVADQGATRSGGSRSTAPDDPDLALPTEQFEFSDSEVRFEPDSTVITTGADAALSPVAACLRDGSTLTVIGHSASTGNPAAELSVSEGRAQNVAARILELAGNPEVTVNAFGVGSSEPKSASGHEPQDRRVVISLTGVCG